MKFLKVILILVTGIILITACEFLGIAPKCGPFDNRPFKVTAINHSIALRNGSDHSLAESPRDFLYSNEFGIRMDLELEKIARVNRREGSFISTAYACSPPPPQLNGRIDSLAIYSNLPYREGLTTGTNLDSLFDIVEVWPYSGVYDPDTQLPAEQISHYFEDYEIPHTFYFFPAVPPSGELADLSFHVVLYLSGDGIQTTEFTTDPVTLIP